MKIEVKNENTLVNFIGFTIDEQKYFNEMNKQCKRKKIKVPNVENGKMKTTLKNASDWLFYQGTLDGGKNHFKVFSIFNNAYNTVKWEQSENVIKIKRYI